MTIAFIGSWAVDQTVENVMVSGLFAVLGYTMSRLDYPRLPIVISLVLGAGIERNFHQSLAMSDGSWSIFFTRTICMILIACIATGLLLTPARSLLGKLFTKQVAFPERRPV